MVAQSLAHVQPTSLCCAQRGWKHVTCLPGAGRRAAALLCRGISFAVGNTIVGPPLFPILIFRRGVPSDHLCCDFAKPSRGHRTVAGVHQQRRACRVCYSRDRDKQSWLGSSSLKNPRQPSRSAARLGYSYSSSHGLRRATRRSW